MAPAAPRRAGGLHPRPQGVLRPGARGQPGGADSAPGNRAARRPGARSASRPRCVDLGTGSGAIALAIKRHRPQARVVATDASAAALEVAQRNAVALGLEVELRHGRWFEPLAGERFEAIISNPPYVVDRRSAPRRRCRFEPRVALLGGADGLDAIPRARARGARRTSARRLAADGARRGPARGGARVARGGGA